MKKLIASTFTAAATLGIASLAIVPQTFAAGTDSYHGADCDPDGYSSVHTTVGDYGRFVSNSGSFKIDMVCPAVARTEHNNTPQKLDISGGRIVGANIQNARLCWGDAHTFNPQFYCGPPKSTGSGLSSATLFRNTSIPQNIADKFGHIFIVTDVNANKNTTVRRYSIQYNP